MKRNKILESEEKFEITSMIDVVFLLLIYFMFLPIQQEADLGITLPAEAPPAKNLELPSEHLVEIMPNGQVLLNRQPMGGVNSRELPGLRDTLARLKASSDRAGIKTVVTIDADPDSPHQRSIDVLNALKEAGVELVSFTMST
ncbi:ExbD/TolR family protein [Puniceicoccus vermicola]|uniref:Biopolymer transporter ExbD n=1 Tax=Puniceicoccus vermicola TaxID=388746 RepID=A0A7X1E5A6_9BACT|nr:biopolymer transporter ExbD [Puniceicoccus vermicola]MBC2602823.1 biopolymer transporter ExbD [Puniceicoccus vermicola]